MKNTEKQNIFKPFLEQFETEQFKNYFMDMVELIPDYVFYMPASTSGKFHNATQCQKYGQLYHVYMFNSILNHRLRLKGNKEKFSSPEERDAMRCIPAFHDAIKCGTGSSTYTVQDHPVLAKKWVLESTVEHDIPMEYKNMIADMCESHSGEWNKSRSGKVIMSEPRNDREFFIHECDILSSRCDLDYIIPADLRNIIEENDIQDVPDYKEYKITFGKHSGDTVENVVLNDRDYANWLLENAYSEPLTSILKKLKKEGVL